VRPRLRFGLTQRAASGGALTARELWSQPISFGLRFVVTLIYGDAVSGRPHSGAFCPRVSMAREASSLSLVTCHAEFFPAWY
jgi:hypothetical protein